MVLVNSDQSFKRRDTGREVPPFGPPITRRSAASARSTRARSTSSVRSSSAVVGRLVSCTRCVKYLRADVSASSEAFSSIASTSVKHAPVAAAIAFASPISARSWGGLVAAATTVSSVSPVFQYGQSDPERRSEYFIDVTLSEVAFPDGFVPIDEDEFRFLAIMDSRSHRRRVLAFTL